MSAFAEKLHTLCCEGAVEAIGNPDASAQMTSALADQLANAIVVLVQGDRATSRSLADQTARYLGRAVFEKAALVRRELQQEGAAP